MSLRINGGRDLTEFFAVGQKLEVEAGVEAAEKEEDLLLDPLNVGFFSRAEVHFRGRFFRLFPDRIFRCSGLSEVRRLLKHLGATFGQEVPEVPQNLAAEKPRGLVSES